MQRSPSQSSMTERTFRSPSPSPHRAAASAASNHDEEPPPVPSIPDSMRNDDGRATNSKPSVNLYTQPFRVASQKKKKDGSGSWFGAATEGDAANIRTSDAALRAATTTTPKPTDPRAGAVSPTLSINFSYPRGAQAMSPPASPVFERTPSVTQSQRYVAPRRQNPSADQPLVYDPNSRRMVPRAAPVEEDVREVYEAPARKKKSQQPQPQAQVQPQPQHHTGVSRSGSHLAKGSVARIKGTAVDSPESTSKPTSPKPSSPVPRQQPQNEQHSRQVESPEPKTLHHPPPVTASQVAPQSPEPADSPEPEQPAVTKDVRRTDGATVLPHPGTLSVGRASAIREESDEDDLNTAAPVPSRLAADSDDDEEEEEEEEEKEIAPVRAAPSPRPSPPVQPPTLSTSSTMVEGPVERHTPSPASILKHHGSVRGAREASNSPVRTPRFAVTPDQLVVRHEPPARSVSPRKSALKHSTSPSRGASPSGDESETSAFASVNGSEDPVVQRKKSARVSFDDQSIKIIGEGAVDQHSDSPIVPSPQQVRRPWYSNIGKSKKKDTAGLEEDEVMKPRPALPMFGSVRDKKPRDTEERPLVRPVDAARSPLSGTPTKFPASPEDELEDPVGQSSDHNVGAILSQDLSNRNEANTSRYREPLPPVVTSLEGSGYYSPSSSNSSDNESDAEVDNGAVSQTKAATVKEPEPTLPADQVKEEILADVAAANGSAQNDRPVSQTIDTIPTISVIQPSPRFPDPETMEDRSPQASYFEVPGGFPDDEFEDAATSPAVKSSELKALPSQSSQPVPQQQIVEDRGELSSPPIAKAPRVSTINEESEASSGDSIYSDAYEDLSDVDGNGFMSLDAVLTTPIKEKVSQKLAREAMIGAASEGKRSKTTSATATTHKTVGGHRPAETADDWEKAKSYWKGLTIEKRMQLEQEAIDDAGIEADREIAAAVPKRTKKKKATRVDPVPEPKAPIQHHEVDPGRVYQIKPGSRAANNVEDPFVPGPSHKTKPSEPSGKLRKSMRGAHQTDNAAPAAEIRMPKTLRSGGDSGGHRAQAHEPAAASGVGMRKSLRQNGAPQQPAEQQTRVTKAPRPVSLPQPPKEQTTPKHQKRATLDSSAAAQAMVQPTLRRRGSDSSESSFKRVRAPRQGFGFRSSMRAASPERPSMAGRNSRFSLRSLSPTPASPPVAMGNRMSMRSTLRSDSSDGSTRRMRIPGFGKNKTEKAKERRYGDSSDEDVHVGRSTGSRFVDSSDEDEPVAPLPASGAMASKTMRNGGASSSAAAAAMRSSNSRQQLRSDSPDLPDSDDDEAPAVQPQRTASGRLSKPHLDGQGLQRKRSGRGELLAATPVAPVAEAPVRPGHSRRGSFFSVLRRKKDKDAGKISRPDVRESAVRQGTKLERSGDELNALRSNNASPKLQKRSASNNWPLADKPDEEKRPATATHSTAPPPLSGIPKAGFMKRRSLSYQGVDAKQAALLPRHNDDESVADAQSQVDGSVKKKKFGKLRKMFGLHD
jgi:hypothetical protein